MCVLEYRRTAIAMNKPLKSGLVFDANFEHPTLQGATAPTRDTQGVASLALGYALVGLSARPCKIRAYQ